MPDDTNQSIIDLAGADSLEQFPALGAEAGPPPTDLNTLDDDQFKTYAAQRGFELHRRRSTKSASAKTKDVKGKTRLTIHLPDDLYQDMSFARVMFDLSKTEIMEEALRHYLQHRKFRRPGV